MLVDPAAGPKLNPISRSDKGPIRLDGQNVVNGIPKNREAAKCDTLVMPARFGQRVTFPLVLRSTQRRSARSHLFDAMGLTVNECDSTET